MKIHTAEKPDAAKVRRMLTAWDHGVEIEDMEDRFGLSRMEIYKILKAHGRNTVPPAMSRQTMRPGSMPRTGRWSSSKPR